MDSSISNFLQRHKVDGNNFTHVSMSTPKGKYLMNRQTFDDFWNLYMEKIKDNSCDIGIAEKPQQYLPILVDIDIKKILESSVIPQKLYNYDLIENIIKTYQSVMRTIIDNCTDKHLICLLLEKPLYTQKKNTTEYVKNGFHLHFPYVFMSKIDQEVHLLPRVKKIFEDQNTFKGIGSEDVDTIVDKSYTKIPWLLYGSKKDGAKDSYTVTKIYNSNCNEISLEDGLKDYKVYDMNEDEIDINHNIEYYLPKILSIIPYGRPEVEVRSGLDQPLRTRLVTVTQTQKKYAKKGLEADLKLAHQLIQILSASRADEFNEWMTVGWALYNISDGCKEGLDLWLDFSKKCPEKFEESSCIYEWNKMVKKDMTIGTLRQFAKMDNPSEYKKIIDKECAKHIDDSIKGSHNDVAKALKASDFGQDFVCASIEYKQWFQFANHRWKRSDNGVALRIQISEDSEKGGLVKMYKERSDDIYRQSTEAYQNNEMKKHDDLKSELKEIWKMMANLKSAPYKQNVMKEAMEVFYDEDFNKKLDNNPWLIGFKNGVYDLKRNIFRKGMREDYLSMQMGIDYDNEMSSDDPSVIETYEFLEKVFPDRSVRQYFLDTTSDVFVGGNSKKHFHVWSGEGDNAKSVTQLLLEKMLGDYSIKLPTSLIVGKRTQASAACPELVRAGNGVRWAVLQEPDKKDILNIGILKELSGNDTFFARGLYKEGSEITPMFKLVLICNDPPQVPYSDKATWNRIRVIPFESTFCDDAPETFEEQLKEKRFPKDPHFADKIPNLTKAFAWVLLNHRKNIKVRTEPDKVKMATEMYRKKNDIYRQFIDEKIQEKENAKLSLMELYSEFKEWYKEGCPNHQVPVKSEIKEYFMKYWGTDNFIDKGCKWVGYKIRSLQDDITNGDAIILDEGDLVTYDNDEISNPEN